MQWRKTIKVAQLVIDLPTNILPIEVNLANTCIHKYDIERVS